MTGTSLFVGGMAYGVRTGLLDKDTYLPAITRGWQAMHRAVHETGFVGYLQGAGSKPEDGGVITYNSVPDFEDFGIGCWLWGAAEVHALAVLLSGENSDISSITDNAQKLSDDYYTLLGQRLTQPQKGINIVNGRKMVVK